MTVSNAPQRAGDHRGTTIGRAASLYAVTAADLERLGSFESEVFAFDGPHGPSVLKVIDPGHRSVEEVQAEVDWLIALCGEGIAVAAPVPTRFGDHVHQLAECGSIIVAFRRVEGRQTSPSEWTDELLNAWGALLGRLHEHSRRWSPPGPRRRRLSERTYLRRAQELDESDLELARAADRAAEEAAVLMSAGPDIGLVHADLHHGNLILGEEGLVAIDFDDSGYGSFAFDLAIPLYYAIRSQRQFDPMDAAARFLPAFLSGFRRHAPEPSGGSETICRCLQLRQAELTLALKLNLPPEKWTSSAHELYRDLRDRTVAELPLLSPAQLANWF